MGTMLLSGANWYHNRLGVLEQLFYLWAGHLEKGLGSSDLI